MIKLHGIYENGRIKIIEKDVPHIKAKAQIIIEDEDGEESRVLLNTYDLNGIFDNENIRDVAYD